MKNQFIRNLIVGLFVAVFGIPIGLKINQMSQARMDEGTRGKLLKSTRYALGNYVKDLRKAAEMFNEQIMWAPSFEIDTDTLARLKNTRYELIEDSKLNLLIDKAHFDVVHVNRRIGLIIEMMSGEPSDRMSTEYEIKSLLDELSKWNETQGLHDDLVSHLDSLKRQAIQDQCYAVIPTPSYAANLYKSNTHGTLTWEEWEVTRMVLVTIRIMVGLTEKEKVCYEKSFQGGAVESCGLAIREINEALGIAID
ncbi:MAG: hypothetical protein HUJ26_18020 [Planctomycetaceae bacterium]|nr:hypothetical protein [Planctomycetaceae bacterium]